MADPQSAVPFVSTLPPAPGPRAAERPLLAAVGTAMGAAMAVAGRLRGDKAVHARGRTVSGTVHRHGLAEPAGVPWLDVPGEDAAAVRFSRGGGLPEHLPDLLGLAVRVRGADGSPHDLLMSSSAGRSPVARHLLAPARDPLAAVYTSVVAYSCPTGPLLLGALPEGGGSFTLAVAAPRGPWRAFARLEVDRSAVLPDVAFDAVVNQVPGLVHGPRMASLRRPAYAASRRVRRAHPDS